MIDERLILLARDCHLCHRAIELIQRGENSEKVYLELIIALVEQRNNFQKIAEKALNLSPNPIII